jgi:hypothetical protein
MGWRLIRTGVYVIKIAAGVGIVWIIFTYDGAKAAFKLIAIHEDNEIIELCSSEKTEKYISLFCILG